MDNDAEEKRRKLREKIKALAKNKSSAGVGDTGGNTNSSEDVEKRDKEMLENDIEQKNQVSASSSLSLSGAGDKRSSAASIESSKISKAIDVSRYGQQQQMGKNKRDLEESEDDEDEDDDNDEEEEEQEVKMIRPVFRPRSERDTLHEAKRQKMEEELKQQKAKEDEMRMKETIMKEEIQKVIEREREEEEKERKDKSIISLLFIPEHLKNAMPSDEDGVDEEAEYNAWKERELLRLSREKVQ